jgi:hypothetical protein
MDLCRREVEILFDDWRRTVAMRDVIGDEVDDPMAGPVEARDPAGIQGDVRIGRILTHPCPPARVSRARRSPSSGLPVAERTPSAGEVALERRWRQAQLSRHVFDREGVIRLQLRSIALGARRLLDKHLGASCGVQRVQLVRGVLILGRDPAIADLHPRPSDNSSHDSRFESTVSRACFERPQARKQAM